MSNEIRLDKWGSDLRSYALALSSQEEDGNVGGIPWSV